MALWFLIPAYNEENNILDTLAAIRLHAGTRDLAAIVVVNDGSADQTSRAARSLAGELPVRVLDHPANAGPGAAFQTAFTYALAEAQDDDLLITMEADNTADLSVLPAMLSRSEHADVVLASCYSDGGALRNCPASRRLLSAGANALVRHSLGLTRYRTCSSFFRLHRCGPLRRFALARQPLPLISESGFTCMVEMLYLLHRARFRIEEIPVTVDWRHRQGVSSMQVSRTISRYIGFLGPLFLNRFAGTESPANRP